MDFYDLDLSDNVLDALDDMNFQECTPIQEHAIPPILEGRDIIGVAQTGTGKTAAYLLPILSLLDDGGYPKDAINCVIMSPTRELAQQIDQAMQGFSYYTPGLSSVAVYGGNDGIRYEQEKRGFNLGADVLIATPGRLISHLSLGNVDLSRVSFFILDEADRMLDMGFYDDIMQIEKALPRDHQTILFSATMPSEIVKLAQNILHDPVEIKIAVSRPADGIHQSAYICYEAQKLRILESYFKQHTPKRVIIFGGSKVKVKDIAIALERKGYSVESMHSDLEQSQRDEAMYRFKSQQVEILVATDIVARGIDIDDIQLVVNFDVPHDAEDYVHRIGRTARAGSEGSAFTLVSEKDQPAFARIEKFLGKEVEKNTLPEEVGEGPAYTGKPTRNSNSKNGGGKGGNRRDRKGSNKSHAKKDKNATNGSDRRKVKAEGSNTQIAASSGQSKADASTSKQNPDASTSKQNPNASTSTEKSAPQKKRHKHHHRKPKAKTGEAQPKNVEAKE